MFCGSTAESAAGLANGPGARAVIWLQGCSTRCPGCFNRHLWDPRGGTEIAVDTLVEWAAGLAHVEGISVSGGEPTDQLPALVRFFQGLRRRTDLSILLFTGRGMDGIRAMPRGEMLLRLPDVLIDGPYDAGYANAPGVWPSSTNQTLHLLTDRYDLSYRFQGPSRKWRSC